ncbi:MAG: hypothetical protein A2293_10545 [Elusimicrobia bacterium RIFOXYB2_FULL_49_7]|nr:MAG: hypothetical protein A2293_10545 [Elusimicrobia bacterium RIFOXYB2_FULL_49_7]
MVTYCSDVNTTITNPIESLTLSIQQSLLSWQERLPLFLPKETQLIQDAATHKIRLSGRFPGSAKLEEAVNNDFFFCNTFQKLKVSYSWISFFNISVEKAGSCLNNMSLQEKTAEWLSISKTSFIFSISSGKSDTLGQPVRDALFDRLLEEFDKQPDKSNKNKPPEKTTVGTDTRVV